MSNTVPFIVTGSGRSGSSLLIHSLRQHPQIAVYGELLNRIHQVDADGRRYRKGEDGAAFLADLFSKEYDSAIRAVGFKLFFHHGRKNRATSTAWKFIEDNRSIRVIWIKRNWFAQLTSLQAAEQTGVWWVDNRTEEKPPDPPRFDIDVGRCERFFRRQEKWGRRLTKETAGHPCLDLEYEDLSGDYVATLHRVMDFLDLPRMTPAMPSKKQRLREPHQQVANYQDLKSRFRGTRFERLFVE